MMTLQESLDLVCNAFIIAAGVSAALVGVMCTLIVCGLILSAVNRFLEQRGQ